MAFFRKEFTSANSGRMADGSEGIQFRKAAIVKILPDGTPDSNHPFAGFLLNPASVDDSKTAQWNQQIVPGQSDPILQWSSSGPRIISFEALVTRDTSLLGTSDGGFSSDLQATKVTNVFGTIAGTLLGNTPLSTSSSPLSLPSISDNVKQVEHQLDITDYLNYYRSFLYPKYDNSKNPRRLRSSPPLVALFIGKTIGKEPLGTNTNSSKLSPNDDIFVVTSLNIKVTKQLPNLAPMEALVTFQLLEYTIQSSDSRRFGSKKVIIESEREELPTGESGLGLPFGTGTSIG